MAEWLVRKVLAVNSNPMVYARQCYQPDDIVAEYPDGKCTEPPSPNSKHYIIRSFEFPLTSELRTNHFLFNSNGVPFPDLL